MEGPRDGGSAARKEQVAGPSDQLETTGESILQLINKAASRAEENSRQAVELAQKLSNELISARDRTGQLESETATSRERAERAEQWLRRNYTEINDRFLPQTKKRD